MTAGNYFPRNQTDPLPTCGTSTSRSERAEEVEIGRKCQKSVNSKLTNLRYAKGCVAAGGFLQSHLQRLGQTSKAAWLRNLPILMARFKTAEVLIALKMLDKPQIELSDPVSYMLRRRASLRMHVRLVERTGRIVRAVDITGEHQELVPKNSDYARPAQVSTAAAAVRYHEDLVAAATRSLNA